MLIKRYNLLPRNLLPVIAILAVSMLIFGLVALSLFWKKNPIDYGACVLMGVGVILLYIGIASLFVKEPILSSIDLTQLKTELARWSMPHELSKISTPRPVRMNQGIKFLIFIALAGPVLLSFFMIIITFHNEHWTLASAAMIPMVLYLFFFPALIIAMPTLRREKEVMRQGTPAPGRVLLCRPGGKGSVIVEYDFLDGLGNKIGGLFRAGLGADEDFRPGTLLTVLYLPQNPKVNAVYQNALFEIVLDESVK
jgi:hypothetical protein